MWGLLPRRTQVLIVVTLTTVVLLGFQGADEYLTGQRTSGIKYVSMTATFIGIVVVGLANWIWRPLWRRVPKLGHWFFPDLNGVWEGTLQTTWKNPETGEVPGPIETTILVRQSLFTTSIKQRTKESESWSTWVFPEADRDADRYRLWYSYENKPKAEVSHHSGQHEGVAWLEVSLDENPDRLRGQYYTSRRTTGDLDLLRTSKVVPRKRRR